LAHQLGIACAPAGLDSHILAVRPAQLPQLFQKCGVAQLRFRSVPADANQHADAPHPHDILRAGRERHYRHRTSKQGYEVTPLHAEPQRSIAEVYQFKLATWKTSAQVERSKFGRTSDV
jgi:hypothetical protein